MAPFDRPLYDFLLVRHCKYSSILYHFWVIWRWVMTEICVTTYRSLKVIQTGTIRKLGCGLLFAFHSNYGSILHQFRNKARNWSKIVIFSYPLHSTPPFMGFPSEYCHPVEEMCNRLDRIPACDIQTDGQTDISPRHSPRYAYASRGKTVANIYHPRSKNTSTSVYCKI